MASDNGFDKWDDYMHAKISKLEEQYSKKSNPFKKTNLFHNISIFVNGLTNPSADELKRIMMVHGGVYHHYQRSSTTFIIASNLADVKIRNMNTNKIISPEWIVDCVQQNRILDYTNYLLYSNCKILQSKIDFSKAYTKDEDRKDILNKKVDVMSRKRPHEFDTYNEAKSLDIFNIEENINQLNNNFKTSSSDCAKPDQNTVEDLQTNNDHIINNYSDGDSLIATKCNKRSHLININEMTKHQVKTAANPQFLFEFYNNSRLHHISILGSDLKQYVSEKRESHSNKFEKRDFLREKLHIINNFDQSTIATPKIIHIDMDCFFVSVGLLSHPELCGKPVAVTHSKGSSTNFKTENINVDRTLEMGLYVKRLTEKYQNNNVNNIDEQSNISYLKKIHNGFQSNDSLSEIASCSYEARKMGIKNGMFVGQALKLCPQLKTIQYDFEKYKNISYVLYDTILQYTLNIEAVSCDEMYVDLTELMSDLCCDINELVEFLRNEVKLKTGCPCSIGIGENKLQARLATKKAKPDGQFHLNSHYNDVKEYIKDLPVSDIPGVGYQTTNLLNQLKCKTCGDIQNLSLLTLQNHFGKKFGEILYNFCRGIDNRPLCYEQVRKSVSVEVNYGIRFTQDVEVEQFLHQLCEELHSRLLKIKRKGKCITLKLMTRSKDAPLESAKFMGHGFCDYLTKSITLPNHTDDINLIKKHVLSTIKSLKVLPHELRGIGIQLTKLSLISNHNLKNENKQKNIKVLLKSLQQKKNEAKVFPSHETNGSKDNSISVFRDAESKPFKAEIKPAENNFQKLSKKLISLKSPPKKVVKRSIKNKLKRHLHQDEKQNQNSNILNMLQKSDKDKKIIESEINPKLLAQNSDAIGQNISSSKGNQKIENHEKEYILPSEYEPNKIDANNEFLNILPPLLRQEVIREILQQNPIVLSDNKQNKLYKTSACQINSSNIFLKENCHEILKSWVLSSNEPIKYDLQVLSNNAGDLVKSRNIFHLYDSLISFKSIIEESNSCNWHLAYKQIIERIHTDMIAVYGGKMLLDEQIRCFKCFKNN